MFDSKTLKKGTGAIIKDPEMLRLIPDYLKTKKMYKHAVKKLPFIIKYVLNQHKTQQMCDKVILKNGGILNVYLWLLQGSKMGDNAMNRAL